jgi:hypothetical protein
VSRGLESHKSDNTDHENARRGHESDLEVVRVLVKL